MGSSPFSPDAHRPFGQALCTPQSDVQFVGSLFLYKFQIAHRLKTSNILWVQEKGSHQTRVYIQQLRNIKCYSKTCHDRKNWRVKHHYSSRFTSVIKKNLSPSRSLTKKIFPHFLWCITDKNPAENKVRPTKPLSTIISRPAYYLLWWWWWH